MIISCRLPDLLGSGSTTYAYDTAGLLHTATSPKGDTANYSFDPANRLTGLVKRKANSTTIADYALTLDVMGNPTAVVKNVEPIGLPTPVSENITFVSGEANELKSAGGVTYTHDPKGNLSTTSNGSTFSFDYANRLSSATVGGQAFQSLYNGFGDRIARTKAGVQTRYVLDLNGDMSQVLAETDNAGNISNYYIYGLGLISKITATGQRYTYHYDTLGSTVAITDDSDNVTEKYAYDEFGKALGISETTPNPFRYVGRYGVMDEGNGYLFMRARYYDDEAGKFVSKDPLGFGGGDLNVYGYVGGNPMVGIDPEGLMTYEDWLYRNTDWSETKISKEIARFGAWLRTKADEYSIEHKGTRLSTNCGTDIDCIAKSVQVGDQEDFKVLLYAQLYMGAYDSAADKKGSVYNFLSKDFWKNSWNGVTKFSKIFGTSYQRGIEINKKAWSFNR